MSHAFAFKNARMLTAAGAAAFALFAIAPAPALAGDLSNLSVEFNDLDLDINKENFLQQLIEMDADDIAELRADLADARKDVLDAIAEVKEARLEARKDPQTAGFIDIAFAAASVSVENSTYGVFNDIYDMIDSAEADLKAGKADVGAAERRETQEAITVLREGLDGVQDALGELLAAMKQG